MCMVSVVYTYGQQLPANHWTPFNWEQYQEVLRKAAEYDRLTSQPDCEDPKKAAWAKSVEERLARLEPNG